MPNKNSSTQLVQLKIGNGNHRENKEKEVKTGEMRTFHQHTPAELHTYIFSFAIRNRMDFLNLCTVNRLFCQYTQHWHVKLDFPPTLRQILDTNFPHEQNAISFMNNMKTEINNILSSIAKTPVDKQLHLLSNVLQKHWKENPADEKMEKDPLMEAETFFKELYTDLSSLHTKTETLAVDKHIARKYIDFLLIQKSELIKNGNKHVRATQDDQSSLPPEENTTAIPPVDYQDEIQQQGETSRQHTQGSLRRCLINRAIGIIGFLLLVMRSSDPIGNRVAADAIGSALLLLGIVLSICERPHRQMEQDDAREIFIRHRQTVQSNLFRPPSLTVNNNHTQEHIINIHDDQDEKKSNNNDNFITPLLSPSQKRSNT